MPAYLIKRRKAHFHSLPCAAAVIIGCNGLVWVCAELREDADGGYNQDLDEVCWLIVECLSLGRPISRFLCVPGPHLISHQYFSGSPPH